MGYDTIKKKIVYTRTSASTYSAVAVEFPIGIGEAVSILAIHWHTEAWHTTAVTQMMIAALSENPSHLLTPPVGVAEFHGDLNLYGMATFNIGREAIGGGGMGKPAWQHEVVPLYGILRPKRQIAVFANIAGAIVGVRGEIYYEAIQPSREIVDAISRRSGKYRRS